MIHEEENDAVGLHFLEAADRFLDRRKLALPPVGIQHNGAVIERNFFRDFLGMRAEDDARAADLLSAFGIGFRLMDDFEEVPQKCAAAERKKRFGRAHTGRLTRGENDGGEHVDEASGKRSRRRPSPRSSFLLESRPWFWPAPPHPFGRAFGPFGLLLYAPGLRRRAV